MAWQVFVHRVEVYLAKARLITCSLDWCRVWTNGPSTQEATTHILERVQIENSWIDQYHFRVRPG